MSGLFGGSPKLPEIKPSAPLPSTKETTKARKRVVGRRGKTAGKVSTMLSSGGRETLGA